VDIAVDAAEYGAFGVDFGGSARGVGKGAGPDLGTEPGYLETVEGVDAIDKRFLAGVCMRWCGVLIAGCGCGCGCCCALAPACSLLGSDPIAIILGCPNCIRYAGGGEPK
jgi:hypothetical protein